MQGDEYPPIGDYALIGDCHSAALISTRGSIDWCCLPRFDSDSCFGRILDWKQGGYCAITPADPNFSASRTYLEDTLILVMTFRTEQGEARLYDFFAMREGGREHP
ncbi:MAG TPA: trehalase-like domain-containing protein, partial [Burkholderiales bacterium]|nr:trehalase-like domain-containing protein [Burkholderiales bacterium]